MSVRDAVVKREEAAVELAKKPTVKQVAEQRLAGALPTLQDVLPKDFDPARWTQVVLVAIKSKPQLLGCFATKEGTEALLLACVQAAELGLEPDTPLGDAWLEPRKNKGRQEARLSISYRGLAKLAMQHPDVKQVISGVVREGDHFVHERGLLEDRFEHKVIGDETRPLTHAYAIIRTTSGAADFVVLDEAAVHRARDRSDSWKSGGQSPWRSDEAAMWQKTAIRRLCTSTSYRTVRMARATEIDERELARDGERIIVVDEPAVTQEFASGGLVAAGHTLAEAPGYDVVPAELMEMIEAPADGTEVEIGEGDGSGEALPPLPDDAYPEDALPLDAAGHDVPPLEALRTRDDWAAWARLTGVKVTEIKPLTSWGDVANAPDHKRAEVYAMGQREP